ncbi:Lrp/AsnC family transcriptional regulator [Nocardia sp. NPDC004711]
MLSLDRLDAELVDILSRNARMGVAELSSELGVARNTIQARLRRLEDIGLLRGFRPDVDLAVAGVTVQAFISLEIEQAKLQAVIDALARIPEVLEIHATTGREDLLARVATETQPDLQQLIEVLVGIDGIVHSSTTLALTSPLQYRVQPLLNKLTRAQGWGRSTPPPRER